MTLGGCERKVPVASGGPGSPAPAEGAAAGSRAGVQSTFAIDNVSAGQAPAAATSPATEREAAKAAVLAGLVPPDGPHPAAGRQVLALAVVEDWGLATWTEGEVGGQTLVRRGPAGWQKVTEGGGWLGLVGLREAGVPEALGVRLLDTLDPVWRTYEPAPR